MCFTRITLLFAVIKHLNNHGGHRGSLIALLLRVVFTVQTWKVKKNQPIQDRDCSNPQHVARRVTQMSGWSRGNDIFIYTCRLETLMNLTAI